MKKRRMVLRRITALMLSLCLMLPTLTVPAQAADWNCWAFTCHIYPKASSAEKTAALLATNPGVKVTGIVGKQDDMSAATAKPYRTDGKSYIEIVFPTIVNAGVYAQHFVTLNSMEKGLHLGHLFGRTVFYAAANTQFAGINYEAVLGTVLPTGIMDTGTNWLTKASSLDWNMNFATVSLHPPVDGNGRPIGEIQYLFAPYQFKGDTTYNFNDMGGVPVKNGYLGYNIPKIPNGTYEAIDLHVKGWTESPTYDGPEFAYVDAYLNYDVDLYPILERVAPFRVSFDLNDDRSGNGSTRAQCNGADSIPAREAHYYATYADTDGDGRNDTDLPIPQRPGYDFAGWKYLQTDDRGNVIAEEIVGNHSQVWATEDVTLLAQWTPHTYTIGLDITSGTHGASDCLETEVTFDAELPDIGTIGGYTMPVKDGETLKGYYVNRDENDPGRQYYNNSGSAVNPDVRWQEVLGSPPFGQNGARGTLYAQWKAQENTLTLDDQGGTEGQGEVHVEYNRTMPNLEKLPQKQGYSFDGYFTGEGGTGKQYYDAAGAPTVGKWDTQNNITLFAKWVAGKTNVTLDPDGGSGGDGALSAVYGEMIPNATTPARTGYDFDGYWDADGVQYINPNGDGIQPWYHTDGAYTLTARWRAHTASVTLNPLGAETGGTENFQATYDQPAAHLQQLPQKIGANFQGYWTADGTQSGQWGTCVFDAGGRFLPAAWTIDRPTVTLYAKWERQGYPLTLDLHAGSDTTAHLNGDKTHTVYYNEYYPTLPTPTRTGYDFTGWYSSENAANHSDVRYLVQSVNVVPKSVVDDGKQTLYAGWKAKVIRVTYQIFAGIEQTWEIPYGGYYVKPADFTLPGQELEGWYDNPEFTGDKIGENTVMNREDDHTLYPKFVGKNVTVSFNAGDGNLDSVPGSITVHYNGPYGSLPALTTDKDNRVFAGWFLEKNFHTEITAESLVENENAHTLYAKWVEGRLTIRFSSNGGSSCPTRIVEKGGTYGENGRLPVPTREGYTFAGWYKESGLTNKVEGTTVNESAGSSELTLYAKWTPNSVKVTFKTSVAAANWTGDTMAQSKTGLYETTTYGGLWGGGLPTLTATDSSYRFKGWYTEAGWKVENTQRINELAEHTLLAGWTDTRATVVLNDSGGTMDASFQVVNLMAKNTPFPLPTASQMSREGYTFLGWSTRGGGSSAADVDITGTTYAPEAESTVYVLYAVWEQKQGSHRTEHYLQNLDGTYTLQGTGGTQSVPAGTQVVAQTETYENYHVNYGADGTISAATVQADQTATLQLFYDRDLRSAFVDTGGVWQLEVADSSVGVADRTGNPLQVRHGGTLAFTVFTEQTGYNPKDVTVTADGTELLPDANGVYTLSNMTANRDVRIAGEQTSLRVFTGQTGYRIAPVPAGPALAPYGGDFRFTLELDPPYSQSRISVSANAVPLTARDGIYTIRNVTEDQEIAVTGLRLNQYQVTYGNGEGYQLQNVDSMSVPYGGRHRFQVLLEETYMGQTPVVRANGGAPLSPREIDGLTYTYEVSPVLKDQHITVDPMEPTAFTVRYPTHASGYRLIPVRNMGSPVPYGGLFAFTLDLDAQYETASPVVTVTGDSGTQTTILPIGGVYYVPDVKEDASIAVSNLTERVCQVDIQEGVGYQVSTMAESDQVGYGGYYLFGIQPDPSYAMQEPMVKVNGALTQPYDKVELEGNLIYSYFLTDITRDTTVTVEPMAKNQFTVKWVVEGVPRTELYELGDVPSYGERPVKPSTAQASYRFTGWEDGDGAFYPAGSALPPVTKSAVYEAQFEETGRGVTVQWVVDGTIYTDQFGYGEVPAFTGETDKAPDPGNTYTFEGWTDGTEDYGPDEELPAATGPVTYTARYSAQPREYTLTVRYRYSDEAHEAFDVAQSLVVGEAFDLETPEAEGYVPSQAAVSGTMPAQDHMITVIYFPAEEGAAYTVTHLLEDLEGGGYTAADTETLRGAVGGQTAAAARDYQGFTAQEISQETITEDGAAVVIHYTRNTYTLSWYPNGGLFDEDFSDQPKRNHYRYGQAVPEEEQYTVTHASTAAQSFAFGGWSSPVPETMPAYDLTLKAGWIPQARSYQVTVEFVDREGNPVADPVQGTFAVGADYVFTDFPQVEDMTPSRTTVTGVMPAQDVTEQVVYFTAADAAAYTVEHYLADAEGNFQDQPDEREAYTGFVGQEIQEGAKTIEGYTVSRTESAVITEDGTATVRVYYTRKSYTVTFELDGGTLVSGSDEVSGPWGAPLTAPVAAKADATFKSWSPAVPDTIPLGGGTYTAVWNAKPSGGGSSGGGGGGGGGGSAAKPEPKPEPEPEPVKKGTYPAFSPCNPELCTTTGHFADNPQDAWYHDYVDYVYNSGLMVGVSATWFGADSTLTRSMLVTILYRMAGTPVVSGAPMFQDVEPDAWYLDPLLWATQNSIVSGYGDDRFGPADNITREQTAAILYRFAAYMGYNTEASGRLDRFADAQEVGSWSQAALSWAVGAEILSGNTDGRLNPKGNATRAQVAALLTRYCVYISR